MSEEPGDRYDEEALRLARMLAAMVREKRVSIRSLEKKVGVGDSSLSKVLRGKITLQVRHVLMIADALEIGWAEVFARAYGLVPAASPLSPPTAEQEAWMVKLLLRLGVIDEEAARRVLEAPPSPEES